MSRGPLSLSNVRLFVLQGLWCVVFFLFFSTLYFNFLFLFLCVWECTTSLVFFEEKIPLVLCFLARARERKRERREDEEREREENVKKKGSKKDIRHHPHFNNTTDRSKKSR